MSVSDQGMVSARSDTLRACRSTLSSAAPRCAGETGIQPSLSSSERAGKERDRPERGAARRRDASCRSGSRARRRRDETLAARFVERDDAGERAGAIRTGTGAAHDLRPPKCLPAAATTRSPSRRTDRSAARRRASRARVPRPTARSNASDTPCVVGLAERLKSRRNSDRPGTCSSAVSSSVALCRSVGRRDWRWKTRRCRPDRAAAR